MVSSTTRKTRCYMLNASKLNLRNEYNLLPLSIRLQVYSSMAIRKFNLEAFSHKARVRFLLSLEISVTPSVYFKKWVTPSPPVGWWVGRVPTPALRPVFRLLYAPETTTPTTCAQPE